MEFEILTKHFWRYYLSLENKLLAVNPYVDFSKDNFGTYSFELALLLQSIGSELDVFMKEMCGFKKDKRTTITDYAQKLIPEFPDLLNQNVQVVLADIKVCPFKGWSVAAASKSLPWWEAYNNIKHARTAHFKQANLCNVINSFAALFILENYQLKKLADAEDKIDIFPTASGLFKMLNWEPTFMHASELLMKTLSD